MADLFYPHDYLPMPLQDGYGFTPVSPLISSQKVNGRSQQRRAFLSTPSAVNVQWFMTAGEAQLFEGWVRNTITDGADWFYMKLQTPLGVAELVKCRFTADFYDGPKLTPPNYWTYSAILELDKRQVIDGDWAEFPDYILNADIIDLAINREWPSA